MFRHFEILLGVSRLGERWTEKDRQLATQHSACYAFAGQNLSAAISIILKLYTIMMTKTKQNLQCVFLVTNGLISRCLIWLPCRTTTFGYSKMNSNKMVYACRVGDSE